MTHSTLNKDIESLYRFQYIESVRYDSPARLTIASCEPDLLKHTIKKLHIENGIIYTFRDEINAFEVEEYLKERIHQYRIGTHFIVFCGYHTSDDGQLGFTDLNLVDHYEAMFKRLNYECHDPIFQRRYKMEKIIPIYSEKNDWGKFILTIQSKSEIAMLAEDIVMTKIPYILILASCYSYRSEVSNILRSSGIYSVLHISEDFGKLTKGKSFFLSPDQRDLLRLVSTQFCKKDIFIFGFYGSGKTLLAVEVVKIKAALQKEAKKKVEVHALVFNEGLNQLKSDMNEKYFCDYDDTEVTDLKIYIKMFSNKYELKPEHQSELEEFKNSSEDFKLTLKSLANQLNMSGKTHIILVDEVDLNIVTTKEESKEERNKNNLELDLSYISEYENVHFIVALRPAKYGLNNFSVSFPLLQSNQHYSYLARVYRNTEAIQRLIHFFQTQIDAKSEGYALMDEIPNTELLPAPLIPLGYKSCVIWVPIIPSIEKESLNNISDLLSFKHVDYQDENNPSIAVLYKNRKSKNLANKLISKNINWSGPHEDVNYNGGEADVVVLISDDHLNVQTLARARRLLIIITSEKEWHHSTNLILKLKEAIALDIAEIMRLGNCPYEMIKCKQCNSKFDEKSISHHIHEQCHVKCQNYEKGCKWKGLARLHDYHLQVCQYELINCEYCTDVHQRMYVDHTTQMIRLYFGDGPVCFDTHWHIFLLTTVILVISFICIYMFFWPQS